MNNQSQKILFIDRDGTLIHEPEDFQVDLLSKISLVPSVIEALTKLKDSGYLLVMVTNQDGLGTESFPEADFEKCQKFLIDLLSSQNITFEKVFICPHFESDQCDCRKPRTGLLTQFLVDRNIDKARSYVIGDRDTDLQLADNLGLLGIKINPKTEGEWIRISDSILSEDRMAVVSRETNETKIIAAVNLDSSSPLSINTGIGFFDHMIEQLGKHSGISIELKCNGDLEVDQHHTVEDVSITLGQAIKESLSNKRGIGRYGFTLPMDDALATIAIDLSDRPFFKFNGEFRREVIGELPTELVPHFFYTFSQSLGANIHLSVSGEDDHHKIEACFKVLGRALSQALNISGNKDLPSTKGTL